MDRFSILFLLISVLTIFQTPEAIKADGNKVFMCYWGTWSIYRPEGYTFNTPQIDPNLCTHLIYSFAGLNNRTNRIGSLDPWCDYAAGECEIMESGVEMCGGRNTIRGAVGLKSQNPDLKVLIAVGGWNQGSERFSVMAADPAKRRNFTESVVAFIQKFELDGLDLDWEYPARRDGAPEDFQNFPILLQELRSAFDAAEPSLGRELVLAAAVGAGIETIDDAYDIPEISKHLDYINVMTYDFKVYIEGEWELIGHHSPLYPKQWEDAGNQSLTTSAAIQYYLDNGAPAEKLTLGVGAYGHTFELEDSENFDFYDPASGPGVAQAISQTPGTIFYNELCETGSNYRFYFDYDYTVPFATDGITWIGFDDEYSVVEKVDYAQSKNLGGMMLWSIDSDDFNNYCGSWSRNGLAASIKRRMDFHANSTLTNNNN